MMQHNSDIERAQQEERAVVNSTVLGAMEQHSEDLSSACSKTASVQSGASPQQAGANPKGDTVVLSTDNNVVLSTNPHCWNRKTLIVCATILLVATIVAVAIVFSVIPKSNNNQGVVVVNSSNTSSTVAEADGEMEETRNSQHFKLVSPTAGNDFDSFGDSIAIEGNIMVVGAPFEEGASNGTSSERPIYQGFVYVYSRASEEDASSEWILEARLTVDDGKGHTFFGNSVALSKGAMIVGSTGGYGSAYIFRRTLSDDGSVAWIEEATLASPVGEAEEVNELVWSDQFGSSVAMDGDLVAVGAWQDNVGIGCVYIFSRTTTDGYASTWTQQAKLLVDDFEDNSNASGGFGASVAISGETVVVSCYDKFHTGVWKVYVYALTQSSWKLQSVLTESNAVNNDLGNVAISGNVIVVGVRSDDSGNGDASGSAYIFERFGTEWVVQLQLKSPNGYIQDHFGDSVAISGNTVAIGANGNDKNGANSGTVYVFSKDGTTWIERDQLSPSDMVHGSFGYKVDISGNTVVASSKERNGDGFSCYIFDFL